MNGQFRSLSLVNTATLQHSSSVFLLMFRCVGGGGDGGDSGSGYDGVGGSDGVGYGCGTSVGMALPVLINVNILPLDLLTDGRCPWIRTRAELIAYPQSQVPCTCALKISLCWLAACRGQRRTHANDAFVFVDCSSRMCPQWSTITDMHCIP